MDGRQVFNSRATTLRTNNTGKTIVPVGVGAIGERVTRVATALGMRVLGVEAT